MELQRPQAKLDAFIGAQQGNEHKRGGNTLGDDGGQGNTLHTHVEHQHKYQIQHRVDDGADHQEVEGPLGIAHSP